MTDRKPQASYAPGVTPPGLPRKLHCRFLLAAVVIIAAGSAWASGPGDSEPEKSSKQVVSRVIAAEPGSADDAYLTPEQRLGKQLFEDTSLSEPRGEACASCHQPKHAFQGNAGSRIAAVSAGTRAETFGIRNTPTLMYMAYSPPFGFYKDTDEGKVVLEAKGGQFWDGRATTLVDQVSGPMLNPLEMNNPSVKAIVAKVKASSEADQLKKIYGDGVFEDDARAMAKIATAIVAFETSPRFAPFSSRFDDYLRGKDELNGLEELGFELFKDKDKGNCIACHAGKAASDDPTDWVFTDFTYDNIGVPRNSAIPANADPSYSDLGLCRQPGLATRLPKGVELYSLCGQFKVPTLRNIAVTGPYFHNGAFESLSDAVKFYASRDTNPENWYPKKSGGAVDKFNDLPAAYKDNVNHDEVPYDRMPGERPRLNDKEIDAIVAFLRTLTDKGF